MSKPRKIYTRNDLKAAEDEVHIIFAQYLSGLCAPEPPTVAEFGAMLERDLRSYVERGFTAERTSRSPFLMASALNTLYAAFSAAGNTHLTDLIYDAVHAQWVRFAGLPLTHTSPLRDTRIEDVIAAFTPSKLRDNRIMGLSNV